jgi:unsaturated rhamnogalacturonyl hydrolase
MNVLKKTKMLMISLLFVPFVAAAPAAERPGVGDAEAIGALLARNLLQRDSMLYGDEALHYSEAAAAVGALRFAAAIGDARLLHRLVERYESLLDDTSPLVSRRPHVDMNVIGIVPLQIAIQTGDPAQLAQGLSFADDQWRDPLDNGLTRQTRWWIDDLYMVGMLQIQAYRATGDDRYADRAARQLAAYLPRLQQANGLFHHGPDAPVFWGRGNGWVASVMAEVLSELPKDHVDRSGLLRHYRSMMAALLSFQDEGGMWRQIIDDESAWFESSATAMFAYAMAVGLERGLLTDDRYASAVERAWAALTGRIDPDGNVRGVCVGTGKSADPDYYLARPRVTGDFHGQAPMLWLAAERADDGRPAGERR